MFAPWDIFGLGGIRTFCIVLSFYASNCSNISQCIYYSQKELKHFELEQAMNCFKLGRHAIGINSSLIFS